MRERWGGSMFDDTGGGFCHHVWSAGIDGVFTGQSTYCTCVNTNTVFVHMWKSSLTSRTAKQHSAITGWPSLDLLKVNKHQTFWAFPCWDSLRFIYEIDCACSSEIKELLADFDINIYLTVILGHLVNDTLKTLLLLCVESMAQPVCSWLSS